MGRKFTRWAGHAIFTLSLSRGGVYMPLSRGGNALLGRWVLSEARPQQRLRNRELTYRRWKRLPREGRLQTGVGAACPPRRCGVMRFPSSRRRALFRKRRAQQFLVCATKPTLVRI